MIRLAILYTAALGIPLAVMLIRVLHSGTWPLARGAAGGWLIAAGGYAPVIAVLPLAVILVVAIRRGYRRAIFVTLGLGLVVAALTAALAALAPL